MCVHCTLHFVYRSAVSHLALSAYLLTADRAACGYADAHESLFWGFRCTGTVEMVDYTVLVTSPSGRAMAPAHHPHKGLSLSGDIEQWTPAD